MMRLNDQDNAAVVASAQKLVGKSKGPYAAMIRLLCVRLEDADYRLNKLQPVAAAPPKRTWANAWGLFDSRSKP